MDGAAAPTPSSQVTPVRGRWRRVRPRVYALLFIGIVHVWILTAGNFGLPRKWPWYYDYYNLLTDAFLHGQTYLRLKPDPKLLALPDPYDPIANHSIKPHDAVLYDGRFYLYWGPVPSLLLVPLRWTIAPKVHVPDTYFVLAFTEAVVLLIALLAARVRTRFFPEGLPSILVLTILAAGLVMPLPYLQQRGGVYEAAIVGGQMFLLAGIYLAFTAFGPRRADGARPPPGIARLTFAGVMWALAVGCRLSLALAVFGLTALVAWRLLLYARVTRSWQRLVTCLLALGLPLAAGAVGLGAYNYARFGSWHESGQQYQLAGVNLRLIGPHLFSIANAPPSLWSYLFRPWRSLREFPFVAARADLHSLPWFIDVPPFYHSDFITGIVWTTPLLALAFVPVFRLLRSRGAGGAGGAGGDLGWLVASLAAASVLAFVPVLLLVGSTMRYFADLTPPAFVLMGIGLWQVERAWAARPKLRRALIGIATTCTIYSGVVAVLLSITGEFHHFKIHNPEFLRRMTRLSRGEWPSDVALTVEEVQARIATRPSTSPPTTNHAD